MHIILGGTSGLGYQLALLLRQQGKQVLVLGKSHDEQQHGDGFVLDIYHPDQVEKALAKLDEMLADQPLEGFVWSAGYGWRGNFEDQSDAYAMAQVNYAGALPVVQWAWRRMIKQSVKSNLIVIGSTSSVKPRPDEAVYVSTKHAQAGLARSLGMQADRDNLPVRVSFFLPGAMKTPFWDGRRPNDYDYFNDPAKIARHIVQATDHQAQHYLEWAFPKGSLI
ncbi:hypothetical protein CR969_01760 [Candidatus Saccharibacteria bacterium]|nr:MAG: hypothetical protein CR969_01760 [Candidatus Saccharibacteria bacterium]